MTSSIKKIGGISYTSIKKIGDITLVNTKNINGITAGSPGPNGIDAYTQLMIHFNESDANFTDVMGNTLTNTGITYTASGKFSGGGSFSGSSYIHLPYNAALNPITGDFAIDWWAKHTVLQQYNTIIGQDDTGGLIVHLYDTGVLYLGVGGVGYQSQCSLNTSTINNGSFHHYALTRSSGVVYMFFDGVPQTVTGSSNTTNYSFTNNGSKPICVGSQNGLNAWGNATVDELRVSIGVPRWTSDFSSSLPTEYYA